MDADDASRIIDTSLRLLNGISAVDDENGIQDVIRAIEGLQKQLEEAGSGERDELRLLQERRQRDENER